MALTPLHIPPFLVARPVRTLAAAHRTTLRLHSLPHLSPILLVVVVVVVVVVVARPLPPPVAGVVVVAFILGQHRPLVPLGARVRLSFAFDAAGSVTIALRASNLLLLALSAVAITLPPSTPAPTSLLVSAGPSKRMRRAPLPAPPLVHPLHMRCRTLLLLKWRTAMCPTTSTSTPSPFPTTAAILLHRLHLRLPFRHTCLCQAPYHYI